MNMSPTTITLHKLHCAFNPIGLHYILQDQPKAHEVTNHILHPSPEPSLLSPGALVKRLCMLCGMVPVSQTGITGSFPKILFNGGDVENWFLVVKLV